jgi:tetratricopeptide (TPR) repeat protein
MGNSRGRNRHGRINKLVFIVKIEIAKKCDRSTGRIFLVPIIFQLFIMKIRYLSIALIISICTVGIITPLFAIAKPTLPSTNSQQSPEFYNDRGMDKYRSGDAKGAIDDYSMAIQLNPRNDLFYSNRGLVKLTLLNDFKGAISDFDSAIEINPKSPVAYYSKAAAKEWLADFERSEQDFGSAHRLMQQEKK